MLFGSKKRATSAVPLSLWRERGSPPPPSPKKDHLDTKVFLPCLPLFLVFPKNGGVSFLKSPIFPPISSSFLHSHRKSVIFQSGIFQFDAQKKGPLHLRVHVTRTDKKVSLNCHLLLFFPRDTFLPPPPPFTLNLEEEAERKEKEEETHIWPRLTFDFCQQNFLSSSTHSFLSYTSHGQTFPTRQHFIS